MIYIYYLNGMIENEPGPNFYWVGRPDDFLRLTFDLNVLGRKNGITKDITNLSYIKNNTDKKKIIFNSSKNGKFLLRVHDDCFTVNLEKNNWRNILHAFLNLSFGEYHDYLDDICTMQNQDANFIISSELDKSGIIGSL